MWGPGMIRRESAIVRDSRTPPGNQLRTQFRALSIHRHSGRHPRPGLREGPEAILRGPFRIDPLVVRRFPRELVVPDLRPAGRTDLPLRTVLRLHRVGTGEALRRVRLERSHIEAELASITSEGDARAATLRQEARAAQRLEEGLVGRDTHLWDVVLGFLARGRRGVKVDLPARELSEALGWRGYQFESPRHRAFPLARALAPASGLEPGLSHALTTEALAALLPLWEDRLEEQNGVLAGLHLDQGTPLFWDRFSHPSHSSAIFGQTGAGKSYASALGFLRLRWARPDVSLFVLDPLGGLAEVVGALGGTVYRAGRSELSLNPLDPATTGGDTRAKCARVGTMLRALLPSLADEEVALIDTALSGLYAERPKGLTPTLGDLVGALGRCSPRPERLLTLLGPALQGSIAPLNCSTTLDLSARLLAFDLSSIEGAELPFWMTLLLDAVYAQIRLRDGPKLIILDEAHYLARATSTAAFLDHLVRHLRHHRAGLELLSQNPEDFLKDDAGRSVLLNLDTFLLLRLRDGGRDVARLLGLSSQEVELLRNVALPGEAGYSGGLLRTGPAHLPVAVVSSDPEHEFLKAAFSREGGKHR